jgi:hypothetical protein
MARKPAPEYPPLPYHGIRFMSFASASIVSAILIYFCYHLKHDDFKIPWTFLVILAASIPALISLGLTICIKSTLFALLINIPILFLWSGGIILLAYNMYGALGHTCSAANWGSHDGIMICQTYKAMFAFCVIGWCAAVAGIVLDFRVRSQQNRLGEYDQMKDGQVTGEAWDVNMKMDTFTDATSDHPIAHGPRPTMDRSPYESYDNSEHSQTNDAYRDERRPRFGGNGDVNMTDFGYQAPTAQTTYAAGSYGEHERSSFDPAPVHRGNDPYGHGARY